jgi:menaquinone-dependent protoporphyrinogen oxidase
MSTIAILYETKYGQTEKIASYVAERVRSRGHDAVLSRVSSLSARDRTSADAFIVLAPIYLGKHPSAVRDFIVEHGPALGARPSAFFSVSGSAASSSASERDAARRLADDFVFATRWRPKVIACFGGAIAYPRYNLLVRFLMKRITKKQGGSTDTSRIHELTNWADVDRATLELLSLLRP